jgi:hypothetical protein
MSHPGVHLLWGLRHVLLHDGGCRGRGAREADEGEWHLNGKRATPTVVSDDIKG